MGRQEKVIVTFDEASRRDFVTGFRKRKQLRRKEAEFKKKQAEKEEKRERRAEKRAELMSHLSDVKGDGVEGESEGSADVADEKYEDDFSKKAFGEATVVVTTTLGLPEEEVDDKDEAAMRELAESAPAPKRGRFDNNAHRPRPKSAGKSKPRKRSSSRHPPSGGKHSGKHAGSKRKRHE